MLKIKTLREIGFKKDNLGDTIGVNRFETMGESKSRSEPKNASKFNYKKFHLKKSLYQKL